MSENLKDTDLSFDEFDKRRRPATVTTSFDDVWDGNARHFVYYKYVYNLW